MSRYDSVEGRDKRVERFLLKQTKGQRGESDVKKLGRRDSLLKEDRSRPCLGREGKVEDVTLKTQSILTRTEDGERSDSLEPL